MHGMYAATLIGLAESLYRAIERFRMRASSVVSRETRSAQGVPSPATLFAERNLLTIDANRQDSIARGRFSEKRVDSDLAVLHLIRRSVAHRQRPPIRKFR